MIDNLKSEKAKLIAEKRAKEEARKALEHKRSRWDREQELLKARQSAIPIIEKRYAKAVEALHESEVIVAGLGDRP